MTSKVLIVPESSLCTVHPNVDKRSFIRWKQRDIHEKRAQRKEDIENLKLSNQVNTTLLSLVDQITRKLETGPDVIDESNIAAAFRIDEAKVEAAPTGKSGPSYQQMLMSLFEEIRKSLKNADGEGKKETYIRELRNHKKNIAEQIVKNENELVKLEKEEKSKITSEGLHEGFSTSVSCPLSDMIDISMWQNRRLVQLISQLPVRKRSRNQNPNYRPSKYLTL